MTPDMVEGTVPWSLLCTSTKLTHPKRYIGAQIWGCNMTATFVVEKI